MLWKSQHDAKRSFQLTCDTYYTVRSCVGMCKHVCIVICVHSDWNRIRKIVNSTKRRRELHSKRVSNWKWHHVTSYLPPHRYILVEICKYIFIPKKKMWTLWLKNIVKSTRMAAAPPNNTSLAAEKLKCWSNSNRSKIGSVRVNRPPPENCFKFGFFHCVYVYTTNSACTVGFIGRTIDCVGCWRSQ